MNENKIYTLYQLEQVNKLYTAQGLNPNQIIIIK